MVKYYLNHTHTSLLVAETWTLFLYAFISIRKILTAAFRKLLFRQFDNHRISIGSFSFNLREEWPTGFLFFFFTPTEQTEIRSPHQASEMTFLWKIMVVPVNQ